MALNKRIEVAIFGAAIIVGLPATIFVSKLIAG